MKVQLSKKRCLLRLLLMDVVRVHDVVEDHKKNVVVDEAGDAVEEARDHADFDGEVIQQSEENEKQHNLDQQPHDVEDDVGLDEVLPVLPNSLHSQGEEDHPDEHHDEGEGIELKVGPTRLNYKGHERHQDQEETDHKKGEQEFADALDGAFNLAEATGCVSHDEIYVHDEQDEYDGDHDKSGDSEEDPG